MGRQISFTQHENKILPEFRQKVNTAESIEDVKNVFSHTTRELLDEILEGTIAVTDEDIVFEPEGSPPYRISKTLRTADGFGAVWKDSDLPRVIHRLAESALGRYKRIEKHTEKTDAKIRR